MRVTATIAALGILIFTNQVAFACGDLDVVCKTQEAIDPGCRGDLCKSVRPVDQYAGKTVDNVVQGIKNSPDDVSACLRDVQKCVINVLATPLAIAQLAYFEGLNRQAQGKLHPFSNEFINLTSQYYDIDLHGVTFADDINTLNGMNVALCDRIYFTHSGNVWTDKAELRLTLHELEHLVQCQKRGRQSFLAEYLLKGLVNLPSGITSIHDNHEFEIAADAKANQLTDVLWNKIVNGSAPKPQQSPQTSAPRPVSTAGVPVRFCSTPIGICGIPPATVPMGTPCWCNIANGQKATGSAF